VLNDPEEEFEPGELEEALRVLQRKDAEDREIAELADLMRMMEEPESGQG
jgi:hypothetical protein